MGNFPSEPERSAVVDREGRTMSELKIETSRVAESLMIAIRGILSAKTLPEAEAELERVLRESRQAIALNLYECEYLDETGLERLMAFTRDLREQVRPFSVYVRPMSFVAFRARALPQSEEVPDSISEAGEQRLAARRIARLDRWRKEKPIPTSPPPGVAGYTPTLADRPTPPVSQSAPQAVASSEAPAPDLVPIDFAKVSVLAGKDERVVQRIWETYRQMLDSGAFQPARDGRADTQLTMDARAVGKELRLDHREVRKVIESVSTHLLEVFGSEME